MEPVTVPLPPTATGFNVTQASPPLPRSSPRVSDVGARSVVMVTALIAAIAMGLIKRTKVVEISTVGVYVLRLNFFMATNAIACVYGLVSLQVTIASRGRPSAMRIKLVLNIVDLLMVGFIFSAIGSALAILFLLDDLFPQVCHIDGMFCNGMPSAIIMSSFSGSLLTILAVVAVVDLYRSSA